MPFTLSGEEALFRDLSGVATPTIVGCNGQAFEEASLFTHKGLSGPAMLQVSSYWRHGESIEVNFLPGINGDWLLEQKRTSPNSRLSQALSTALPNRLAQVLAEKLNQDKLLAQTSDKSLTAAQQHLQRWPFSPSGTEGFAKAEVTVGGISTAELSSKTMQANKVPGLYAIGSGGCNGLARRV